MATINAVLLSKPTEITVSSTSKSPMSFRRGFCCQRKMIKNNDDINNARALSPALVLGLGLGAGLSLTFVGPTSAASELLQLAEPSNALSLPTWAIHVSSVAEWITAMALVWQYGDISGNETWKGLSWGMVPLLGGAFCACTWHFFYNSESLEILVALQAALTTIGNATMCYAAYRIYKASQEQSKNL